MLLVFAITLTWSLTEAKTAPPNSSSSPLSAAESGSVDPTDVVFDAIHAGIVAFISGKKHLLDDFVDWAASWIARIVAWTIGFDADEAVMANVREGGGGHQSSFRDRNDVIEDGANGFAAEDLQFVERFVLDSIDIIKAWRKRAALSDAKKINRGSS